MRQFVSLTAIVAVAAATPADRDRRSTWSRRLLAVGLLLVGVVLVRVWTGPDGWRVGPIPLPAFRPFRVFSFAAVALIVSALASSRFRAAWQARSVPAFYAVAAATLWLLALGPEPAWLGARALTYGPYRLVWALYERPRSGPNLDARARVPRRAGWRRGGCPDATVRTPIPSRADRPGAAHHHGRMVL